MLTKRAFLRSAGALATLPATALVGDAAEADGLRLVSVPRSLAPQGPATPTVRIDGLGAANRLTLLPAGRNAMRVANALAEPVSLAWQGLRGIGDLDQPPAILPAGAAGTIAAVPLDSGTALLRATASATHLTGRGLQAVVVVPEPSPLAVDHDRVIHLQDWVLGGDNGLRFGPAPAPDAMSACITVNGEAQAQSITVAPRARLRLRFISGSVQRLMVVACTGARPMIAAIDGQPSELFAPVRNIVPLGPGARYDLLLDAPETAGAEVRFSLKATQTIDGKLEPERDLLRLRTDGAALPEKPPLAALPPNPKLPLAIPLEKAVRADLTFDSRPGATGGPPLAWSVNGHSGAMATRPVLNARRGDAIVFGLFNASPTLLPLRIGGHAVRLLHAKDDGWEPYWRDTVLLPPKSRTHVAFVADTPGRWAIDSGFDAYTLSGLSCCFTVTPG